MIEENPSRIRNARLIPKGKDVARRTRRKRRPKETVKFREPENFADSTLIYFFISGISPIKICLKRSDSFRIVVLLMKNVVRVSVLVIALSLISFVVTSGAKERPDTKAGNQLKVGMAEIDITPPVGYRMAGYYDERFSTGVHDPLKAKAIVLQQGTEKVALVFCDLVGISLSVSTNARARASAHCGIPVSNISLFATHSHTGPLFNDIRGNHFNEDAIARYGFDAHQTVDYPTVLIERVVKAIAQANKNLAPGRLDVGIAQQEGLPFNRRYHMRNGRVAFNPGILNTNIVRPASPVDHDVGIVMVRDAKEKILGGLTVFAMHADCVGGTEFSADYPFFIQQTLREKFGTNYISAFGAGTCGDLNQIDVTKKAPFKGFAAAQNYGERIGKTVIAAQENLSTIKNPSLAVRRKKLIVPLQEVSAKEIAEAREKLPLLGTDKLDFYSKVRMVKALDLAARGQELATEIQVYRLDSDTAMVGLPAEIFVEFGLSIKKQSPFKNTLVLSICNDRPCYVPTLKAFKEGSYEVTNSRVKPGVGELFAETAVELLKQLKSERTQQRPKASSKLIKQNHELLKAATAGDLKKVKTLIAAGADINYQEDSGSKFTPLLWAIYEEHYEVAIYLLRNGANANIPDASGMQPLDLATRNSSPDAEAVFQLLKEKGAKPGHPQ